MAAGIEAEMDKDDAQHDPQRGTAWPRWHLVSGRVATGSLSSCKGTRSCRDGASFSADISGWPTVKESMDRGLLTCETRLIATIFL